MESNSSTPPLANDSSSDQPQNPQIFGSALLVDRNDSSPESVQTMPSPSPSPSAANSSPSAADSSVIAEAGSSTPSEIPAPSPSPNPPKRVPTEKPEPRHCWICLTDEGIDSPEGEEWRSPCKCNLQAHESCLLEWISDLQTAARNEGSSIPLALCPQCRTPIKVDRPTEFLILLDQFVRTILQQAMLPGGLLMGMGILYSGSMVYGFNTIEAVFGERETMELLRAAPQMETLTEATGAVLPRFGKVALDMVTKYVALLSPFVPKSSKNGLFWVAPLIAPALLLSRTSLADGVFNVLPIPYLFYQHFISPSSASLTTWPPSPGTAFLAIPYIRELYNAAYAHLFAAHIKRWQYASQRRPREGETAEDIARRIENDAVEREHVLDIQIEILEEVGEDEEGEPRDPHAPRPVPVAPAPVAAPPAPAAAADGGNDAAAPPAAAEQPPADNWGFRRNISVFQLARTVIATLFFPSLSSIAGDVLYRTLPKTWVHAPSTPLTASLTSSLSLSSLTSIFGLGSSSSKSSSSSPGSGTWRKGLLQEKWGRTLVGGAVLILMKDAVHLYVLWRRAKLESGKRVLDWDKSKKRYTRAYERGVGMVAGGRVVEI